MNTARPTQASYRGWEPPAAPPPPPTEQVERQPTDAEYREMLEEQRSLTRLALMDLRARVQDQPALVPVTFGPDWPTEQLIRGFPESPFRGVAVFNNTQRTLKLGFNASAALGSPLHIKPRTLFVWPAAYQNLNVLSVNNPGALEVVGVLRLQYPPAQPAIYPI
jgi:hypothetical protein